MQGIKTLFHICLGVFIATQLNLGTEVCTCENGKGLAPAEHRIRMCQLAVADSPIIMVDPWEVSSALVACSVFISSGA